MSEQNNQQLESKRKTLKAILGSTGAVAGASALPENWTKPIISSVILPVHAGGSGEECEPLEFGMNAPTISGNDVTVEMFADGNIDFETSVQVEINYFFEGGGESSTFETQSELGDLIEGQTFEVTTSAEVSEVNSVEALFDYCEDELNIEWD